MKLALEISFYIFLVIAVFGGFLLVILFRWIFGEKDILALYPQMKLLPTPALEEVKKLLNKMREQVPQASPARRAQLMRDLELMDKTVQEVEFRIENQQAHYLKLCGEREKVWESVKEIVDHMSSWEQLFGKKKNLAYTHSVQYYKDLNERIEGAAEHAKFQGELLLAEIRGRGVYQQNAYLLYPPKNENTASRNSEEKPQKEEYKKVAEEETSHLGKEANPTKSKQKPPKKAPPSEPENSSSKKIEKFSNIRPELEQADFPKIGINVKKYKYTDSTFNLDFVESGVLRHYDFEGCIFRRVHFAGAHQYDHCNFKQVDFTGATWLQVLKPHRFDNCDFSQANLSDCRFDFTAFYYCRFDQSQWTRIQFRKVKFVSCYMNEVQWQNVDLSQVVMSKDMLAELDFSVCAELPQNHPDRLQYSEEQTIETSELSDNFEPESDPAVSDPPDDSTQEPPPLEKEK